MGRAECPGRAGDPRRCLGGVRPHHLHLLPQGEILRQVWVHHYYWDAHRRLRWRDGHALPPTHLRFDSLYDTEAHYCVERDTARSGYRVHLTESCDQGRPELVVHVATAHSIVQDVEMTRSSVATSPSGSCCPASMSWTTVTSPGAH